MTALSPDARVHLANTVPDFESLSLAECDSVARLALFAAGAPYVSLDDMAPERRPVAWSFTAPTTLVGTAVFDVPAGATVSVFHLWADEHGYDRQESGVLSAEHYTRPGTYHLRITARAKVVPT